MRNSSVVPVGNETSFHFNGQNSSIISPFSELLSTSGPDGLQNTLDDSHRSYLLSMWVTFDDLTNPLIGQDISELIDVGPDSFFGTADDIYVIQRNSGLWAKGISAYGRAVYRQSIVQIGPDLMYGTSDDIILSTENMFIIQHTQIDQVSGVKHTAEISFNLSDPDPFVLSEQHHILFAVDAAFDVIRVNVDFFFTNSASVGIPGNTSGPFKIGSSSLTIPTTNNGHVGKMDSVVFWLDTVPDVNEQFFIYSRGVSGDPFVRGDTNTDGVVDIADAVTILDAMFNGLPLSCVESADVNSDGSINLADPINILGGFYPFPFVCTQSTNIDDFGCLDNDFCD